MDELTTLVSVAAPLLEDDVDTDVIFPARFLLLLDREGLGRHAFSERRGLDQPFVLDTPECRGASILVCGHNFGTGSSREQAVWALADLGVRCIVARSFGEIFRTNCLKNGMLAITLDGDAMRRVEAVATARDSIALDLPNGTLALPEGLPVRFDIADEHREMLMSGRDDTDRMLTDDLSAIEAFELRQAERMPWISIPEARFVSLDEETQHHE